MAVTRRSKQARPQHPGIRELRVDDELVYEAVDRQRRHRNLKFREVAQELGVAPATVTGWGRGVGFSADHLARALAWLGRSLSDFVTTAPAEPRPATQDTAA